MSGFYAKNRDCTTLNNGNKMPLMGFGTLQIRDDQVCEKCIYEAIRLGVRMIDTASSYFNEKAVGRGIQRAISDGIVKREELFIITKLWIQDAEEEFVRAAVKKSMDKLSVSHLDLYLVHQPYGNFLKAWPVMEEMVEEGILRNIGVCNFSEEKLKELLKIARIKPVVNQIEIHPYFLHKELTAFMEEQGIQPMAWGPLFEGQRDIFHQHDLVKIAEFHQTSVAQVILRWHFERGVPAIPKTVQMEHLKENVGILDFTLTEEEKQTIESLDLGYSEIIDYKNPMTEKWLTEWKIHN